MAGRGQETGISDSTSSAVHRMNIVSACLACWVLRIVALLQRYKSPLSAQMRPPPPRLRNRHESGVGSSCKSAQECVLEHCGPTRQIGQQHGGLQLSLQSRGLARGPTLAYHVPIRSFIALGSSRYSATFDTYGQGEDIILGSDLEGRVRRDATPFIILPDGIMPRQPLLTRRAALCFPPGERACGAVLSAVESSKDRAWARLRSASNRSRVQLYIRYLYSDHSSLATIPRLLAVQTS